MKIFIGKVISAKLPKTVTVRVERKFPHSKYGKIVTRSTNFLCQDDLGVKEGDTVTIKETKPMSARKRFIVMEKAK